MHTNEETNKRTITQSGIHNEQGITTFSTYLPHLSPVLFVQLYHRVSQEGGLTDNSLIYGT